MSFLAAFLCGVYASSLFTLIIESHSVAPLYAMECDGSYDYACASYVKNE